MEQEIKKRRAGRRGPQTPTREIHIGLALRALRWPNRYRKPLMTQIDLAERLGVSDALISKWEAGRRCYHPGEEDIEKICEVFHVTREELEVMAREAAKWSKAVDKAKPAQAA